MGHDEMPLQEIDGPDAVARPRRRFHHNPQVFGPTPDGYYLIFSIGNDKQPQEIIGCDAQVPPWSCSLRSLERREGRSPGVRARVKHTRARVHTPK